MANTNKSVELVFVNSDEWSGIYIDGVLEVENHRLYSDDWLNVIEKYGTFHKVDDFWLDADYLEELGNMPEKLEDIPEEHFL